MIKKLITCAFAIAFSSFVHAAPSIHHPSPDEIVKIDNEPSHRLALTGQALRVFDVLFSPGSQSMWHSHHHDSVLVTLEGANVPSDTPGKERVSRPPMASGFIYYKGYQSEPFTHRVTNEDNKNFRILDVEILSRSPLGLSLPPLQGDRSSVIDNDRVRVSKAVIPPGQTLAPVEFKGSRLYVSMADGEYSVLANGSEAIHRVTRGQYFINEQSRSESIRNTGTTPVELVFIEVK